jgi:hypothetical protein
MGQLDKIEKELEALLKRSIKTTIRPQKFINKLTGEIATTIPLLSMGDWEKYD